LLYIYYIPVLRNSTLAPLRQLRLSAITAALAGLSACSGSHDSVPTAPAEQVLTRVVISLPSDTIQVGQSYSATAAGFDQTGKPMSIQSPTWTTDSPVVASVSASGVVLGLTPGLTTVNAIVGATQGYRAVTVIPVPVARVSVTPAADTVNIGLTVQLSAALLDAGGNALTGRTIAWTSSDAAKATVSPVGLVTALAAGVVSITATCEGISAPAVITVPEFVVGVSQIDVSPPVGSLLLGQTLQLDAILTDTAGNTVPGRAVTWSSSAPGVATVSATGLVRGTGSGTATITAAVDLASATATISVSSDLAISIARPDSARPVGDTLFVQALVATVHGIASIVASILPAVGYFDTPLVFSSVGKGPAWNCHILIQDLKAGDYQLVVTVTDSIGTVSTGSVNFHHDYGHEGGKGPSPGKKRLLPPPPRRRP
jgi:hypothetical protein